MKGTTATEYSVEQVELEHASDDQLRPFVDFAWKRSKEEIPEDPVQPFEALAARLRMTSPMFVRQRWAVWSGPSKLAGSLVVSRSTQDNLNIPLDAGWISQEDLCQGVEPGTVDACG